MLALIIILGLLAALVALWIAMAVANAPRSRSARKATWS